MTDVTLRLLVLKSPSPEALARFYQLLGLDFVQEQHGPGPVHYSTHLGDCVLEIYPLTAAQTIDTTTRLGFSVEDPDAIAHRMESLGGRILKPGIDTPWGYLVRVRDPDGRTIELSKS